MVYLPTYTKKSTKYIYIYTIHGSYGYITNDLHLAVQRAVKTEAGVSILSARHCRTRGTMECTL